MSSFYATDGADAERRAVSCGCLAHRHGNAAYRPVRRRAYPTDASDAEWAAAVSMIPVPAWMGGRGGRPEGYWRSTACTPLPSHPRGTSWSGSTTIWPPSAANCFTG